METGPPDRVPHLGAVHGCRPWHTEFCLAKQESVKDQPPNPHMSRHTGTLSWPGPWNPCSHRASLAVGGLLGSQGQSSTNVPVLEDSTQVLIVRFLHRADPRSALSAGTCSIWHKHSTVHAGSLPGSGERCPSKSATHAGRRSRRLSGHWTPLADTCTARTDLAGCSEVANEHPRLKGPG